MVAETPFSQPPRRSEPGNSLIERAAARLTVGGSGGSIQPLAPSPGPVTPIRPTDSPRLDRVIPLAAPAAVRKGATPTPAVVEQFRMIGHQLLRRAAERRDHQGLSVMVTSPKAGDGRTFVAIHLALALAGQSDSEVVLVDADLDRPSVAARLGASAETGLRDYLSEPPCDLAGLLITTDVPRLLLVPGGPVRRTELALGGRLRGLPAALRQSRGDRIVVFDTPCALSGSSMPILLAPLVDEIIVVVAAEETEAAAVGETLEHFQDHSGKLSLVFNKSTARGAVG